MKIRTVHRKKNKRKRRRDKKGGGGDRINSTLCISPCQSRYPLTCECNRGCPLENSSARRGMDGELQGQEGVTEAGKRDARQSFQGVSGSAPTLSSGKLMKPQQISPNGLQMRFKGMCAYSKTLKDGKK